MESATKTSINKPSETVRSPNYRDVYANNLKLALTPFDIVAILGVTSEQPPGTAVIEEQVTLRLSPQFCKNLATQLSNVVAVWETQFGEITVSNKLPEDVAAAVNTAMNKK
jgi:hypothetical protein